MAWGTVERATELDVNWCNDKDMFEGDGQRGELTWTSKRDGEETASIGYVYRPDPERLRLVYTVTKRHSDESVQMDYTVPIDRTECHFGGTRPWFRCPVCDDRVGKLYKASNYSEYACRDCQGLLYESQKSDGSPLAQASRELRKANERIQDGDLSRSTLRDYYDAQQAMIGAHNATIGAFDEKRGRDTPERFQMNGLDPFDEWLDHLFHETFGSAGGRSYGHFGRCTATSKTTGDRCRQPARGEHGKCYYHGGASGTGVGEEQVDRQAEAARERIEQLLADIEQRKADVDGLLAAASG